MIRRSIKELVENDKLGYQIVTQIDSNLQDRTYTIRYSDQKMIIQGAAMSDLLHAIMYMKRNIDTLDFSTDFRIVRQAKQAERGLMLDIGRKFYSLATIKKIVDSMCLLEMNFLQLHFSENEGFRIESETFPEIVSERYLSKNEIRELIGYCQDRGIEMIPELDSPGHLKCLLQKYPEFALRQTDEVEPILANRAIDITNPDAVAAVKKLLAEYLVLFSDSHLFHIGADEYLDFNQIAYYPDLNAAAEQKYGQHGSGYDLYIAYINSIVDYVRTYNYTVRIWNDGLFLNHIPSSVELTKDVEITYWTRHQNTMADVATFIDNGYQVVNFNDNFFYFVLGEAADYEYPTASKIKNGWQVNQFPKNQLLTENQMSQVSGTYFAIWSDRSKAMDEFDVYHSIFAPLKAQQEKLWETVIL